jgi:ribosomal protein S10
MKQLKIKLITPNSKILKLKLYFIIKFCFIFNLKFKEKIYYNKKKKTALLRSPHIHKKTWQNYFYKFCQKSISVFIDPRKIIKMFILLKILSANTIIKIKIS